MQYQVPQFIEVEDKVFGPFTFKQFAYLAGGAGAIFVLYKTLPFLFAIPLIVGVGGLALALAFYKVNNRPFVDLLESMFKYSTGGRLYVWKKEEKKTPPKKTQPESPDAGIYVPQLSESKLRDLAWSLDIQTTRDQGQQ